MWGLNRFANGTPYRYAYRILDGYVYYARLTDATPDEQARADRERDDQLRIAARTLEHRWRTELLPELDASVAFLDSIRGDEEPRALIAAWNEAWARTRRAWEIHFD